MSLRLISCLKTVRVCASVRCVSVRCVCLVPTKSVWVIILVLSCCYCCCCCWACVLFFGTSHRLAKCCHATKAATCHTKTPDETQTAQTTHGHTEPRTVPYRTELNWTVVRRGEGCETLGRSQKTATWWHTLAHTHTHTTKCCTSLGDDGRGRERVVFMFQFWEDNAAYPVEDRVTRVNLSTELSIVTHSGRCTDCCCSCSCNW